VSALAVAAAQRRFPSPSPQVQFDYGDDRVELWDAEDFDPWTALRWQAVRVIFYRQKKRDGTVVEAYWLTDFSIQEVSSQALFGMAKSRWEIENQGFNEAKTLHGLKHLCHHHPNSMLVVWLLTALAMTIDRLYRHRYLHRGTHRILAPIDLVRLLRASLSLQIKNQLQLKLLTTQLFLLYSLGPPTPPDSPASLALAMVLSSRK